LKRPIVHIPLFAPPEPPASPTTAPPVEDVAAPYFLFAGRLERLKGVDSLMPVFRRYQKAQLWIAGKGSDEARLRQLAGDSPNIRFLGPLDAARLDEPYRAAVALIVPSKCYESFAMVIVEAFRQRTPVIVRDLGAMSELVQDSGAGLLYSSEPELLAAMDRFLDDPQYRRRVGARGYDAYREKWTPDAHVTQYFALIRQLAAGRGLPTGVEVIEPSPG
jgi:glycosyltransferase involved in cell wall biosynthesis